MKRMKKFVAALLVLTMALTLASTAFAASAKFTKADKGAFVQFKKNLQAYTQHSTAKKSGIIVKKGSKGKIVDVYGSKWVKVQLTSASSASRWFQADKLEFAVMDEVDEVIAEMLGWGVLFVSGGSGRSSELGTPYAPELKGKTVKTTGKVSMRKNASLKGGFVGSVPKGKKVTLTGNWGLDDRLVTFFEVKYNGKKGFISEGYIRSSDLNRLAKMIVMS